MVRLLRLVRLQSPLPFQDRGCRQALVQVQVLSLWPRKDVQPRALVVLALELSGLGLASSQARAGQFRGELHGQ